MTQVQVITAAVLSVALISAAPPARAAGGGAGGGRGTEGRVNREVSCDSVLDELGQGKRPLQVAHDLDIPLARVRRCRRSVGELPPRGRDTGAGAPGAAASPGAATE